MGQLHTTPYPSNLEKSPVLALEEETNLDELAGDVDDEAIWYLAKLIGGPE